MLGKSSCFHEAADRCENPPLWLLDTISGEQNARRRLAPDQKLINVQKRSGVSFLLARRISFRWEKNTPATFLSRCEKLQHHFTSCHPANCVGENFLPTYTHPILTLWELHPIVVLAEQIAECYKQHLGPSSCRKHQHLCLVFTILRSSCSKSLPTDLLYDCLCLFLSVCLVGQTQLQKDMLKLNTYVALYDYVAQGSHDLEMRLANTQTPTCTHKR